VSGAIARGIGALSTPIFTRLLTPSEYGLYPLYNTWLGVLSVIVTLEVTGSAIYRGFQKYDGKKDEFTSAALGLIGSIFVGFCAVYFAFYGFLGDITGLNVRNTVFMFAQILGTAIISLYLAKARYEYKYKAVAVLNMISAVTIPLSAIMIISLSGVRAEARIYASSIITLLIAIPLSFAIVKNSDKLYSGEIWRYLLGRSIPLLPHYFATALILKAGEISIGRAHGTEALGRYSIAISVGMIMTVVTVGLTSALSPWIMRKIREGSIDKMRDFLFALTKALALLSLGVLAIAPEILSFLAAEGFREALPAVYPLEIAVILSFLSGAVMSGCAYYERGGLTSLPSIAAALVSVVLSAFVLPNIDYRFAGVFALISYFIMMLLTSFVFKRLSGEYPINLKKGSATLILTITYATVLFVFRSVLISRIFLALPLIPLLILSARDIWEMIRE
jgi:O-antigen/teichoic acid export membrane protein